MATSSRTLSNENLETTKTHDQVAADKAQTVYRDWNRVNKKVYAVKAGHRRRKRTWQSASAKNVIYMNPERTGAANEPRGMKENVEASRLLHHLAVST